MQAPGDCYPDYLDMALSILLGAGIALFHGAAGLLVYWWAMEMSPMQGIKIALGGAAVRLVAALAAVILVITYAPIHVSTFITTLFAVFVIMLAVDVVLVVRMSRANEAEDAG